MQINKSQNVKFDNVEEIDVNTVSLNVTLSSKDMIIRHKPRTSKMIRDIDITLVNSCMGIISHDSDSALCIDTQCSFSEIITAVNYTGKTKSVVKVRGTRDNINIFINYMLDKADYYERLEGEKIGVAIVNDNIRVVFIDENTDGTSTAKDNAIIKAVNKMNTFKKRDISKLELDNKKNLLEIDLRELHKLSEEFNSNNIPFFGERILNSYEGINNNQHHKKYKYDEQNSYYSVLSAHIKAGKPFCFGGHIIAGEGRCPEHLAGIQTVKITTRTTPQASKEKSYYMRNKTQRVNTHCINTYIKNYGGYILSSQGNVTIANIHSSYIETLLNYINTHSEIIDVECIKYIAGENPEVNRALDMEFLAVCEYATANRYNTNDSEVELERKKANNSALNYIMRKTILTKLCVNNITGITERIPVYRPNSNMILSLCISCVMAGHYAQRACDVVESGAYITQINVDEITTNRVCTLLEDEKSTFRTRKLKIQYRENNIVKNCPQIDLSEQQTEVIGKILRDEKQIISLNAMAGTGKTSVLRTLVWEAVRMHGESNVLVTASTASAVNNIISKGLPFTDVKANVVTLSTACYTHKWRVYSGFSHKDKSSKTYKYKYIFIDEMSMVPDTEMEILLQLGEHIVLVGDMYQLPPVRGSNYHLRKYVLDNCYELSENFRCSKVILDIDSNLLKNKKLSTLPELAEFPWAKSLSGEVQFICTTNDICNKVNTLGEKYIKDSDDYFIRLRKNYHEYGLINGQLLKKSYFDQILNMCCKNSKLIPCGYDIEHNSTRMGQTEIDEIKYMRIVTEQSQVYYSLAFGITPECAQGQEWDIVVLVIDDSPECAKRLADLSLLHTIVTRARVALYIINLAT